VYVYTVVYEVQVLVGLKYRRASEE